MLGYTAQGGGWKECQQCGKRFFVRSCDDYVYQRWKSGKDKCRLYFCGWNHMRAYDKQHEVEDSQMRREAALKGHKNRKGV